MENFWTKLPKPFFVLAPMADVTDAAFRRIVAKYGKPDVLFTEFTSADGLMHPKGREKLLPNLWFTEVERPIVAQLFGSNSEKMKGAAALVKELGFDGLDINMGCPDKTIEKQGSGAAMIRHPERAREVFEAAREGANGIPVSIKTRIGFNTISREWVETVASWKPEAVTLHLRTRKEMSLVPAHWELAKEYTDILQYVSVLSVGNGDVMSVSEGKEKARECGMDGIMIGRGVYGNPYIFAGKSREEVPIEERMRILVEHTRLFEELYGDTKSFATMKKFFKAYISGHPEASQFQTELMLALNALDVEKTVQRFS